MKNTVKFLFCFVLLKSMFKGNTGFEGIGIWKVSLKEFRVCRDWDRELKNGLNGNSGAEWSGSGVKKAGVKET
jgi:hypothetical protein